MFHGILQKIAAEELRINVSLFDVPKLYEENIPAISMNYYNYPTHTLCKEDQYQTTSPHVPHPSMSFYDHETNCTRIWKDYMSNSLTNPYELDEDDDHYTCGKGLGNLVS